MYRFKTTPFKHQLDCFERSKERKFFALLMEMGTGKSKVLLDTAAYMFDQGWINGVLILANKGSYMNWATNEIPAHFVDHIERKVLVWKSTLTPKQEQGLKTGLFTAFSGLKFFLMNIEALPFARSAELAQQFVLNHRCLAVCDESTVIKSISAKRTKVAWALAEKAVAQRIMTGSLVDNKPLNAYSQFEFLKRGCLGFTSFYAFRAHYAELVEMRAQGRSFRLVKGYRNLEDLRRRLGEHSFIIKKEDCLDLPPKVYQTFNVELTDEQQKVYTEIKRKCMTELEGSLTTVKIILTKIMRLHQIVCGHLKDDDGIVHHLKNNRISALLQVLEEAPEQVIIWANYREDISAIKNALTEEYGAQAVMTFYGDTDGDDRERARRVFYRGNDTEGVRFLVSNPASGGFGNNFTGATLHVYYSNDYDGEKRNQSEDRSHRIGQTEKVTYIDLVSPDTVDEKILKALKEKKNLAEMLTASNWKDFL